ncbi:hypothetical protein [Isobaculum melis]|uniref:DUF961 domain-containing protein n=1 Tax=Isobaculum melis TaxID=142588 RepID=A0A1H9TNT2_9LACT|nr:hypothetical protein [Isobaculum melis]SER98990.1 hypothetical protein SAMN04488559_11538 [Isobaculum melis]
MKITMTEAVVKESFGDILYIGCEVKREYDRELPELERPIKSATVTVGAEKYDKSIEIKLEADEKGAIHLPNVKKFAKVKMTDFIYDPKAKANTFSGGDSGETTAWGTLNENFTATTVQAVNPADKLADENGEKNK